MTDEKEPPPPWAIIAVAPATEENAERWLRRAGYRTYFPLRRRIVYPGGRRNGADPRMLPLIPGYIFAQDWHGWPNPKFHPTTLTGMKLLRNGWGKPLELAQVDIEKLRSIEIDQDMDWPNQRGRPRKDANGAKVGDDVESADQFWRGKLVEITPQGRAILDAIIFGREVRTEIDANELRKVE